MLEVTGATRILLDETTESVGGSVFVEGGRVVADPSTPGLAVARALAPEGTDAHETLDATDCVVTPGLVNAHHHLLQSGFRTLPGTRGVPMAEWLPTMAAAYGAAGIDSSLLAATAAVGIAEGLLNGVTTVADHHLNWPSGVSVDEKTAIAEATASAARRLGSRLVFVRGSARDSPADAAESTEAIVEKLLSGSAGGFGGPGAAGHRNGFASPGAAGHRNGVGGPRASGHREGFASPDDEGNLGDFDHSAGAHGPHGFAPGSLAPPTRGVTADGMLQVAVGPAGVHSDSRETYEALARVAERHGLRRRTQANEQVDVGIALERYGRRPLDLLDDWGWLAPDVTVAHLCDLTDDEIARLGRAGVTATHAPGCDLPMGWGIAPVARLRDAGVTVGLGTSGGGSNDAGHLLADARLAMQVAPLVGPPLAARYVLGMATAGGATGLGRPELGHLRVGAAADLCVWDVGGVADAGVADPVAGLLWASPGRRPRHVVVAGRVVVRDYALVAVPERSLTAALRTRLHL